VNDDRYLIARSEDATPEWFTAVLRAAGTIDAATSVVAADGMPVGTGQAGTTVRFALTYADGTGPASLITKFGSIDPGSASVSAASGAYETEVAFYREIAPTVTVDRPQCHYAAVEPGTANTVLVFEDLASAHQGDQIAGASVEAVEAALVQAARLHGPRWGDPRLVGVGWLDRDVWTSVWPYWESVWQHFTKRYGEAFDDVTRTQGARLVGEIEHHRSLRARNITPVHGDFRLDNLLFHPPGQQRTVSVVDWQTARLGHGVEDVAYLVGTSFASADERRAAERSLVERYHAELCARGVADYPFDECWQDYCGFAFSGLVMAVVASLAVVRTERGDAMFLAMASRSAQMAADLYVP